MNENEKNPPERADFFVLRNKTSDNDIIIVSNRGGAAIPGNSGRRPVSRRPKKLAGS